MYRVEGEHFLINLQQETHDFGRNAQHEVGCFLEVLWKKKYFSSLSIFGICEKNIFFPHKFQKSKLKKNCFFCKFQESKIKKKNKKKKKKKKKLKKKIKKKNYKKKT